MDGFSDNAPRITGRAVLHGPPSAPCVAAWHARDAVISGDLKFAWLFDRTRNGKLRHRQMQCTFTPNATVPQSIFSMPGTVRHD